MIRFALVAFALAFAVPTARAADACPPEGSVAGCSACDAAQTACDCVDCACENCPGRTEVLTPSGEHSAVTRRVFLSGGPIRNGLGAILDRKPVRTGLVRLGRGAARVAILPFRAAKAWRQAAVQRRSCRRGH